MMEVPEVVLIINKTESDQASRSALSTKVVNSHMWLPIF